MSTPLSNATSYASAADFLGRYDARSVGDYVSDLGVKVDPVSLLTNANLLTALADASGMVESACLVGLRYQPSDLAGLTGNSLSFLKRLVCDLAIGMLMMRRPQKDRPIPVTYEMALEFLERLRTGERIFGIQETAEAGTPQSRIQDQGKRNTLNLASLQAGRYFGNRADSNRPFTG